MKCRYCFLVLIFIIFSNCSSSLNDEYKDKLESYALSLQNKYGTNFQDKVEFFELDHFTDSIEGARIGNYKFQDYDGNIINLLEDSRPVLLESFASWCAPCVSSIPALNQLSQAYPNVRFIVLTHDTADKLAEYAKEFNTNIHLVPSETEINASGFIKLQVGEFQSIFPFPATFTIHSDGIIENVLLGAPRAGNYGGKTVTLKEVHEANMLRLSRELDKLVSE
ncbi:TlpA family protein disulfide reductase [Marivirga sp.]|uniref:TlpA family protein disulfide reductase n=1 Tax=Marivirga sp. TaxID=2018662 RepID=UPI003DA73B91